MSATVAYAVVHTEPPSIFLADDIEVLHRVLALEVVARSDPAQLGSEATMIREALLEERWGDAVVAWIRALGPGIDLIGAQLQFTRLFGGDAPARLRSAG